MEKGQKYLSICGNDNSLEFHGFNTFSNFQPVDYRGGASFETCLIDGGTRMIGMSLVIKEVQK